MALNTFSLSYSFIFMIFGFNYAVENSDMYVIKRRSLNLYSPIEKFIATLQNKLEAIYLVLDIMCQFRLHWLLFLIILLLELLLNVCLI